jgi:hypothetical protein
MIKFYAPIEQASASITDEVLSESYDATSNDSCPEKLVMSDENAPRPQWQCPGDQRR